VSWGRVAVIYGVLALLAAWVFLVDPRDVPEPGVQPEPPPPVSMLGVEASTVTSIGFRKGTETVRATREGTRWRIVEPADASITSDLVEAVVATLTAGQGAERLDDASNPDLTAYGLDAPSASLDLALASAPDRPITVLVGGRNPTQTAVYARRSDAPTIFLVGMNLRYYIDLVFDAAKR
jgi:hypothetical protein